MGSAAPAWTPRLLEQAAAATAYGATSLCIMLFNKVVLSVYGFPSFTFLALAQFVITAAALYALRQAGFVSFPRLSRQVLADVFPLPLLFLLNTVTGLGSTKKLNLPMMTVLRRFSIVMTMVAEFYLLNVRFSAGVAVAVLCMVVGAFVAAIDDLAFDLLGYTFIFWNDFFTAANGVVVKQKLEAKKLGTYGLMYYNTLLSIPLLILYMMTDRVRHLDQVLAFPHWSDPAFLFFFAMSSLLGFAINYSTYWCTHVNSALTTTVVGCLKNILSTYVGMVLGGDYIFSAANFVGLNISVVGSIVYTVVKYKEETAPRAAALPPPVQASAPSAAPLSATSSLYQA